MTDMSAGHKLWEKAVFLSITFPPGESFNFANETLASVYLRSEEVKIACSKNGAVVLPTDYPAHGIEEFLLRQVAYLDQSSNGAQGPQAKFTVLGFPRYPIQCGLAGGQTPGGDGGICPTTAGGRIGLPVVTKAHPGCGLERRPEHTKRRGTTYLP